MILSELGFFSFGEENSSLKYIAMTTDQLLSLPLFIPFPPSVISCCHLHVHMKAHYWSTGPQKDGKMRTPSRDAPLL